MRISKPRNIVRQLERSNAILKNQLNKLLELRARIGQLESMVPGWGINPPTNINTIQKFQAYLQRKIRVLMQELDICKHIVETMHAEAVLSSREKMLQDLKLLRLEAKLTQEHEHLENRITSELKDLTERLQRLSRTAEQLVDKFVDQIDIEIIAPRKGDVAIRDKIFKITWRCHGPAGNYVNITLFKGPHSLRDIARQVPNDGFFDWLVHSNISPGSDYKVCIWGMTETVWRGWWGEWPAPPVPISFPYFNLTWMSEPFEIK
jgi:hypothetical protein